MGRGANFRKVSSYIWRDRRFRRAGTDGQLLFLYLWTGPESNATGVSAHSPATLAIALHWPVGRAQAALTALADADLADVDADAEIVGIDLLECDPPDNGNVVKHWAHCLADMPQSPVIARALTRLKVHCAQRGDDFRRGFDDLMAALPVRFKGDTVSHTVPDTVSHTVPDTVSQTVCQTPPKQSEIESEEEEEIYKDLPTSGSGARARDPHAPEAIGAITARALEGLTHE